jgi:hypothetical protein
MVVAGASRPCCQNWDLRGNPGKGGGTLTEHQTRITRITRIAPKVIPSAPSTGLRSHSLGNDPGKHPVAVRAAVPKNLGSWW